MKNKTYSLSLSPKDIFFVSDFFLKPSLRNLRLAPSSHHLITPSHHLTISSLQPPPPHNTTSSLSSSSQQQKQPTKTFLISSHEYSDAIDTVLLLHSTIRDPCDSFGFVKYLRNLKVILSLSPTPSITY